MSGDEDRAVHLHHGRGDGRENGRDLNLACEVLSFRTRFTANQHKEAG
jgi:hypothetical protein